MQLDITFIEPSYAAVYYAVQSVSKCGHINSLEDYLTMVLFTML